ncbi:MAG: AbrB/MazE/SpoVT family DNA-binding domain-containing protein [Rhizobiales bacterium]|nr:AbrB/MazE/SpoVT family DNA-binding domain-containing protein [Hyphomicrobiales bacterium]MDQ3559329.1 AbrB/MazE/SpoVT family DNA-binding domain-containing protein [Pseudomonadota bacterium]
MQQVKVTQIGNSLGVVLPKDVVERLGIARGQQLSLSETPNGIELSPFDPDFEEQMRLAEEIMDRYRDTLRELAK